MFFYDCLDFIGHMIPKSFNGPLSFGRIKAFSGKDQSDHADNNDKEKRSDDSAHSIQGHVFGDTTDYKDIDADRRSNEAHFNKKCDRKPETRWIKIHLQNKRKYDRQGLYRNRHALLSIKQPRMI
jgi:hypothetical protein